MCLVYSHLSLVTNLVSYSDLYLAVYKSGDEGSSFSQNSDVETRMYHILLDAGGLKGRRDARTIYLELS